MTLFMFFPRGLEVMSKQSDVFITMEFKRKNYRNEINKALRSGSEKIINDEINRVNKVMRERIKKLESKGMEKMSTAYKALGEALGTANGKPVILRPAAIVSLEDKIRYLQGMRSVIDNKTMTVGGVRDYLYKQRQSNPILQKIYEKHGEEYTAEVFGKYWELIKKVGNIYSSLGSVNEHENQVIEILENFHDNKSLVEFNEGIEKLSNKIYHKDNEAFDNIISKYLK